MGKAEKELNDCSVYMDKYTMIKPLGQGGEGSVFLARDEHLQRYVAIKRVCKPNRHSEDIRKKDRVRDGGQGLCEADHLRQLRHPMLPVLYDLFEDGQGVYYLVMEYIQGMTLEEYIVRNGFVKEKQACRWGEQMSDILEYLHTRKPPVIYRDLKPQNVIVCPDRNLRLVDFGAAYRKNFGAADESRMAFTPGYSAPEQFYGNGKSVRADERSDIYALGMMLYYMVTGADVSKPPYTSLSVWEYQPFLGDAIEKIIRRCIKEEPAERYQLVEEVRKDLIQCERCHQRHPWRQSFIKGVEKQIWLTEMQ